MACFESGDVMKKALGKKPVKISTKKKQEKISTKKKLQGSETTHTKQPTGKQCARGICVRYDGDPTRCGPWIMDMMKRHAESAIDVYNKTHLKKYSFVELVHVIREIILYMILDMVFTAKHEPEDDADDEGLKTFRARVCVTQHYVEFVELQDSHQEDLAKMNSFSVKDDLVGSVLYDRDHPTFCDGETLKVVNQCADLAMEVYNKTHQIRYCLVEVVHATVNLSAGTMVDMLFIAKLMYVDDCEDDDDEFDEDRPPRTFRARVSATHNYVEFVHFATPARRFFICR